MRRGFSSIRNQRKNSHDGNNGNTKLFTLLLDQKWEKALSYLKRHPEEAFMTGKRSDLNLYPLHLICLETSASVSIVGKYPAKKIPGIVMLVQRLLECYPNAAAEHVDGDAFGRLPLHVALANRLDMDLVQHIFDVRKDVCSITDFENNLPLHIALQARCELAYNDKASMLEASIIQAMVEFEPTSIYTSNNQGLTPLQIAATLDDIRIDKVMHRGVCLASTQKMASPFASDKNTNIKKKHDNGINLTVEAHVLMEQEKLLARYASPQRKSIDGASKLLKGHTIPLNENLLYHFITKGDWEGAMKNLLENPKEASQLWIFDDGRKMYPLYVACASNPSFDLLSRLAQLSPESVKSPDKDGRLPIHVGAIYNVTPNAMQVLIQAAPDTVFYLDHHGKEAHSYAVEYDAAEELKQLLLTAMCDRKLQSLSPSPKHCTRNDLDSLDDNITYPLNQEIEAEVSVSQEEHKVISEPQEGFSTGISHSLKTKPYIQAPVSRAIRERSKAQDEPVSCVEGIWIYKEFAGKKVMDSPLHTLILNKDWKSAIQLTKSHKIESTFWIVTNVHGLVWKRLPLHEACKKMAPSNVIEALLQAFPTSPGHFDNLKMLPIHYACSMPGTSLDTIAMLVSAAPNSARISDRQDYSLCQLVQAWDVEKYPEKTFIIDLLVSNC